MDGYDPNVCKDKLQAAGLTPACEAMSNPFHCDDFQQISPVIHAFCAEVKSYYAPVQAMVCMYYQNGTPIQWKYWPPDQIISQCTQMLPQKQQGSTGWTLQNCYCCCSCFAYNTMIAVPDGQVAIQEIRVGDLVQAANIKDAGKLEWQPSRVTFSSGVEGGVHPFMVYINHGEDPHDVICNADQVFMLSTGKLCRAAYLTLKDELVDADGAAVKINMIGVGSYTGGVHHINTDRLWENHIDGHLILADGVVAGDFLLQMNLEAVDAHLREDAAQAVRPMLGTPEYADQHAGKLQGEAMIAFSAEGHTQPLGAVGTPTGRFTFYGPTRDIGVKGVSMFTEAQSLDILNNGTQLSLSNPVPQSEIANIFRILKGFYPEFNYYLDWYRMEPNVWAFEEYGQKFVMISGGLARMVGLSYEGLMMAVGHGVARYIGLPPTTREGWVATGAADYFDFGVISRAIWYGNSWLPSTLPAFDQLKKIFDLISPENAGGDPNDPAEYPSVACRLSAMQSGMAGGALPECCGGPPAPQIALQSAKSQPGGARLYLSIAPIPEEAENVANYSFEPAATVTKATVDTAMNFVVNLEVELTAGTDYEVTIANMHNYLGGGVNPDQDSAAFKAE